jgi:hypothetical protein
LGRRGRPSGEPSTGTGLIDRPDRIEPIRREPRRRRLRGAAAGILIGTGVILAGFAFDRVLVIVAGVLVILSAWWLAAETRIGPGRGKRSRRTANASREGDSDR